MPDLDQRVTDGLRELVSRAPVDADVWPTVRCYVARHRRRRHAIVSAVIAVALLAGALTAVVVRGADSKVVVSNPGGTTDTTSPGRSYTDSTNRFSVTIPNGWNRAEQPLVPYVADPQELLSAGTVPLLPNTLGPACDAQLPKSAIDALSPTDVFVLVIESHESGQLPNPRAPVVPSQFPTRPNNFADAQFQAIGCSGPTWSYPNVQFQRISFQDHDRVIHVFLAWGNAVSQQRRSQTWELLNSLRFAP
jgi:hypothetical protein